MTWAREPKTAAVLTAFMQRGEDALSAARPSGAPYRENGGDPFAGPDASLIDEFDDPVDRPAAPRQRPRRDPMETMGPTAEELME